MGEKKEKKKKKAVPQKLFLSYAREDLEIAKKIYDDLTDKGVNVWLDDDALLPGQNWRNEITKGHQREQLFSGSAFFQLRFQKRLCSKRGENSAGRT